MTSTTGKLSGFSLVELIVVIGIISSIVFAGSLYFQHHLSQTLLKTSAQELASTLMLARRLAITKRKVHKVVFEPQRRIYWIEDEDNIKVERTVHFKKGVGPANPRLGKWGEENGIVEGGLPDNALLFYPQGTAEGASIYLKEEGSGKWYTITVTPSTGAVKIYTGKH
ncbi:prepilin-type N-terminal cleavage/methylation domain-containing protein [Candidatus Aerophobetes bacterium]|nr:prepilin-type N-terminal cleavage/methylation domain-containing protein [Candidatus Aerophobetes bacterium]